MKKKLNVGGQAVIEGVMMRSPNYYAVSVRNEKGKIITKSEKIKQKNWFLKLFFIRGIVNKKGRMEFTIFIYNYGIIIKDPAWSLLQQPRESLAEEIQAEFDEKVTEAYTVTNTYQGVHYNRHSNWDDMDEFEWEEYFSYNLHDSDLTFTYESGVIVGLTAKGKAKKSKSDFIVD